MTYVRLVSPGDLANDPAKHSYHDIASLLVQIGECYPHHLGYRAFHAVRKIAVLPNHDCDSEDHYPLVHRMNNSSSYLWLRLCR
jgi:3',5'-cyclic AMP phosphodiesterase CpdA